MQNFSFRYYNASLLVPFILVLSAILDSVVLLAIEQLQFNQIIRMPSNAAIIGLIIFLVDKYLWKVLPFSFLVKVPNLNGRYKGSISFSRNNQQQEKECVLEIYQTASIIKVTSYFRKEDSSQETRSISVVENIIFNEDNTKDLMFYYQNKGTEGRNEFDPHDGINVLKCIKKEKGFVLKGYYFTNREPQTQGNIEVKFISMKVLNHF